MPPPEIEPAFFSALLESAVSLNRRDLTVRGAWVGILQRVFYHNRTTDEDAMIPPGWHALIGCYVFLFVGHYVVCFDMP